MAPLPTFSEVLEIEDTLFDNSDYTPPKKRGPKPRTISNPLDGVSPEKYVNSDGRPRVWLDDCLVGSIRAIGTDRDKRLIDPAKYVSLTKVFKVLLNLRGEISSPRVIEALGVCRDTAWRIIAVIEFASFSIERELKKPSRILEYQPPTNTIRKSIC